uniref:Uncharacterized protein n=1 Tax=Solanum lycopersicum TaxID=4081 RepID=K4D3A0_SOLLC
MKNLIQSSPSYFCKQSIHQD